MLLFIFTSKTDQDQFLTLAAKEIKILGTAWQADGYIVIQSFEEQKLYSLIKKFSSGTVKNLTQTPMGGQTLLEGRVVDIIICARCNTNLTTAIQRSGVTWLKVEDKEKPLCKECLHSFVYDG